MSLFKKALGIFGGKPAVTKWKPLQQAGIDDIKPPNEPEEIKPSKQVSHVATGLKYKGGLDDADLHLSGGNVIKTGERATLGDKHVIHPKGFSWVHLPATKRELELEAAIKEIKRVTEQRIESQNNIPQHKRPTGVLKIHKKHLKTINSVMDKVGLNDD